MTHAIISRLDLIFRIFLKVSFNSNIYTSVFKFVDSLESTVCINIKGLLMRLPRIGGRKGGGGHGPSEILRPALHRNSIFAIEKS